MAVDTENYRTESLRNDEVERYRKDGFLLAGKVISDSTIEKLRAGLAELAASATPEGTVSMDLCQRDERTKDYSFDFLAFLWKTRPEFREVAFSQVLAKMAAQLLGTDKVVLLGDSAFIKPPQRGGQLHWHQDNMAWPLDKPGGLSVWIALDEANPENGSMTFAEGSHLLGERLPADGRKGRDLSNSGMVPVTSPKEEGLVEVKTYYHPGECSFHDILEWHASGFNTTDTFRRLARK
jgi:ectoine hydroxylase-related dioxygenase (phytanoyl-CoA dioxygenase family)